ncbi:MAG: hypothetical protein R3F59_16535 [Myxococcota bacterium]
MRVAALALAAGCAQQVPLDEVPVLHGTDAQAATVQRGIAAFEAASGAGRVTLRRIVFDDVYGALGQYDSVHQRVRLDHALHGAVLERVLRHELCHALDFQEDLVADPDPRWDDQVRTLFRLGAVDTAGLDGPRIRRSEAFARYCELGPLVAHALRDPCPEEAPEDTDVFRFLARRVWRASDVPPLPPLGEPHASWVPPQPPYTFDVLGLDDPGRIALRLDSGVDVSFVTLDLDSGAPVPDPGLAPFLPDAPLPAGLEGVCPLYADFSSAAGFAAGPAAVVARFWLYPGASAGRVLADDGSGWAPLPGCVPPGPSDVFATADGRVWLAWTDGGRIAWAALLEGAAR